jgi:hypothetical protein
MALIAKIDEISDLLGKGAGLAIIRSELTILREQAEAVESRLSAFETSTQNDLLEEELERLRADLADAKAEIESFCVQQKEQTESDRHATIEEVILISLPLEGSPIGVSHEQIAQKNDISNDAAACYLENLRKAELAGNKIRAGGPTVWYRSNTGNEYLFRHGLLR